MTTQQSPRGVTLTDACSFVDAALKRLGVLHKGITIVNGEIHVREPLRAFSERGGILAAAEGLPCYAIVGDDEYGHRFARVRYTFDRFSETSR